MKPGDLLPCQREWPLANGRLRLRRAGRLVRVLVRTTGAAVWVESVCYHEGLLAAGREPGPVVHRLLRLLSACDAARFELLIAASHPRKGGAQ